MLKRILTGALLTLITILGFVLRGIDVRIFDLLLIPVCVLCAFEFTSALKDKITREQKIIVIIFSITTIPVAVFFRAFLFYYVGLFMIFTMLFSAFLPQNSVEKCAYVLLALIYPTVPLSFISLINSMGSFSAFALIIFLSTSIMTDTMAYFVGVKFQGRKLCVSISPNKTVSGAIGGLIGGVIASVLTYLIFVWVGADPFKSTKTVSVICFLIASGILFSIINQIGDLFESAIKRSLNVKDMGNLLPGHGGMLDRVDGMAFNAIAVYILYSFLV